MAVNPGNLDLPREPGVYLFKNNSKKVLYVGKATEISVRVRSYFSTNPDRLMIPKLIEEADYVDCIVTTNPDEALILERELIRKFKPRFNSMFKDDRTYPLLTLTNEEIPRIMYTRNPNTGDYVWGPFTDAKAAKKVMYLLRSQFGIRDCPKLLPQGCLSMHIGLCAAPCIDSTGYDELVETAKHILDGDASKLLIDLVRKMDKKSNLKEYERAGEIRDLIKAIRTTLGQQVIFSRFYRDCDAIGFAKRGEIAVIVVMRATNGVVQGQQHWSLIYRGDIEETICRFISEYYSTNQPPSLLLLPCEISDFLENWLLQKRGLKIELRVPKRGKLRELRNLADKNAEIQVERERRRYSGSLEQRAVDECAEYLNIECLDHIVCFDMAQLQGKQRVGASISLKSGRPEKSSYRKYKIKGKQLDDIGMMLEVLTRWLKYQKTWPDLLLIDGGEVHLKYVYKLLKENGLENTIFIAALAKREETLYRLNTTPIVLDKRGRVLIYARDEAHRFVNKFHRKSRQSNVLQDPLEFVEGIGAKKIQTLLRHFGGRQGLLYASVEDLCTVPGIGKSLAERIKKSFSKRD